MTWSETSTAEASAQPSDRPSGRSLVAGVLLASGPPLVLAALGLVHPTQVDQDTAQTFWLLHVVLLPLFPLLAIGPWLVTRRGAPRLAWLTGLLGYAYATGYTVLDVLAGIGVGALGLRGADQEVLDTLGLQAYPFLVLAGWAFLAATALASAVALYRARLLAVPGTLLVLGGAWFFRHGHITWPQGGLSMVALAAGWLALLLAVHRSQTVRARRPAG